MIIAPSILNIKDDEYQTKLNEFSKSNIKMIHLDIMDGVFVPNKTDGEKMIQAANDFNFVIDVHLMVKDPSSYLMYYKNHHATFITFHYEAVDDVSFVIKQIKDLGLKAGISIKPNTSVDVLKPYLKDLDLVLIMSVEPGYGGQSFIESSISKLEFLDEERNKNHYSYVIEIDGGINLEIAKRIKPYNPDILVMGTYLLKQDNVLDIVNEVSSL